MYHISFVALFMLWAGIGLGIAQEESGYQSR